MIVPSVKHVLEILDFIKHGIDSRNKILDKLINEKVKMNKYYINSKKNICIKYYLN